MLLKRPQHQNTLENNLAYFTNDGFGVLQTAFKSGSESMFHAVLELLRAYPSALKANLTQYNFYDSSTLLQALVYGSDAAVNMIIKLSQRALSGDDWRAFLLKRAAVESKLSSWLQPNQIVQAQLK